MAAPGPDLRTRVFCAGVRHGVAAPAADRGVPVGLHCPQPLACERADPPGLRARLVPGRPWAGTGARFPDHADTGDPEGACMTRTTGTENTMSFVLCPGACASRYPSTPRSPRVGGS